MSDTVNLNLSTIHLRSSKESAIATNQIFINKNPDFQREYESWDDKLKTRFIETMLIGRAMNPIWTIFNPDENSEEILDGMHRITTAIDFLNNIFKLNSKFLTDDKFIKYDKCKFEDLELSDQQKIRNYNFTFNNLDSSYRIDVNKRRDMYEILNRSSKTLNDYEFNKVLYNPFYTVIHQFKERFKKFIIHKKDSRGQLETEIIDFLVLSEEVKTSWSSINDLKSFYLENKLGKTDKSVKDFLNENSTKIHDKLEFILKIIDRLNIEKLFSSDKKTFNHYFIIYKFFICRICYKLQNISVFNRHIKDLIKNFKNNILEVEDLLSKFECKHRNAQFQKKLIQYIDEIIDQEYDKSDPLNRRIFDKKMIQNKLKEQNNKCKLCTKVLLNCKYEADHIIPWSQKGETSFCNLQILCVQCHLKK
jgi:hypothetical protein